MAQKNDIKGSVQDGGFKEELFIYDRVGSISGSNNLVEVRLNGKTGIIDLSTQKVVVPCKYNCKESGTICENYYAFIDENSLGHYYCKDTWEEIPALEGKIVWFIFSQSKNIMVEQGEKYAIQDQDGNVISNVLYDKISIGNHAILVQVNGKWGVLDRLDGVSILPCEYDNYKRLSDGIMALESNGKWGIVDLEQKKVTVPCEYEDIKSFEGEMIPVKAGGKWGFINKHTWNLQIPCAYSNVELFVGEYAAVEQRKRWGVIDKNNEKILLSKYKRTIPVPGGLIIVWDETSCGLQIIDKHGDGVYDGFSDHESRGLYYQVKRWSERYIWGKNNWGLFSAKTGKLIVPCQYGSIFGLGDEFTTVSYEGREQKGIFDIKQGRQLTLCKYDRISRSNAGFHLGMKTRSQIFYVEANGERGVFDAVTGREEFSCKYSVRDIKYDEFNGDALIVCFEGKYGLIDRNTWEEILPCVFDAYQIYYNVLSFRMNGKYSIFDSRGRQIEIRHSTTNDAGVEADETQQKVEATPKTTKSTTAPQVNKSSEGTRNFSKYLVERLKLW